VNQHKNNLLIIKIIIYKTITISQIRNNLKTIFQNLIHNKLYKFKSKN